MPEQNLLASPDAASSSAPAHAADASAETAKTKRIVVGITVLRGVTVATAVVGIASWIRLLRYPGISRMAIVMGTHGYLRNSLTARLPTQVSSFDIVSIVPLVFLTRRSVKEVFTRPASVPAVA